MEFVYQKPLLDLPSMSSHSQHCKMQIQNFHVNEISKPLAIDFKIEWLVKGNLRILGRICSVKVLFDGDLIERIPVDLPETLGTFRCDCDSLCE